MNAPNCTTTVPGAAGTDSDATITHAFAGHLSGAGDMAYYCLRTEPTVEGPKTFLYRTRHNGPESHSGRFPCGPIVTDDGYLSCIVRAATIKRFSACVRHQPRPRLFLPQDGITLLYQLDIDRFNVTFAERSMSVEPKLTYVTDKALAVYEAVVHKLLGSGDDDSTDRDFAAGLRWFESACDPAATDGNPVPLWCLDYLRHLANPCDLCDAGSADPMPQLGLAVWSVHQLIGMRQARR